MIVCTRCGFQNEDSDTFCGSCAGFLEWSGHKVDAESPEEEPTPEAEPESDPEPDRAGFVDRVKDRMGIGDTGPGEAATGAAAAPAAPVVTVGDHDPGGGGPVPTGPAPAAAPTPAAIPAEPISAGATATAETPAADTEAVPAAVAATSVGAARATSVAPVAAPPPPPAPATTSTASGTVTAPVAAPTVDPPAHAPDAGGPAAAAVAPAPVRPGGVQPGSEQPSPMPPGSVQAGSVQPGSVQPGSVQPGSVQPEAVKPTAVRARPAARPKTAPARVVNPGDLVCGQCGEGNDPNRKFCRRCGASLQRATVFILPWYQRWWRRLTTRKTRAAGDRPASRRRAIGGAGPGWLTGGFMKVLGIAIVLLVLLTIVGPWRGHLRHDVSSDYHRVFNDVHPKYNPVHPFAATATTSAPGHPAANAIDGAVNTSWQTNAPDSGIGQSLKLRLGTVSNLDQIGFLNGDQDTPSSYLTEPRPEKVHLTAAGAHPYSKDLTLKDTATFQTFTIKAKDASSLTITVDTVYPSDQGKQASMAEVELFVKT